MESSVASERVLVIVESPAKAKTIAGYLNRADSRTFEVEASIGHVRDLASADLSNSDVSSANLAEVPETAQAGQPATTMAAVEVVEV